MPEPTPRRLLWRQRSAAAMRALLGLPRPSGALARTRAIGSAGRAELSGLVWRLDGPPPSADSPPDECRQSDAFPVRRDRAALDPTQGTQHGWFRCAGRPPLCRGPAMGTTAIGSR